MSAKDEEIDQSGETMSRENPISEFLRSQGKDHFNSKDIVIDNKSEEKSEEVHVAGSKSADNGNVPGAKEGPVRHKPSKPGPGCFLNKIVLKFTTVSDGCNEAPSFTVGTSGASIGRDPCNTISVPSDLRLAPKNHTFIEYSKGYFYIIDGGFENAASIRIGVGVSQHKLWPLDMGARFSAGNSVFECKGINSDGNLLIQVLDGPLKGQSRIIPMATGASLGRSSENSLSIPDKELSRKHSKIEFNQKLGKFVLLDNNSTNGTYMQLVGPNGGKYRLHLNDHILVGRTGFSINRFDYGLSEEIGIRQTMEDACTIVQHLSIGPLCIDGLAPQSFFGVFDGHVGNQASTYLSQHLHCNIADALMGESIEILKIIESRNKELASGDGHMDIKDLPEDHPTWKEVDSIVYQALKTCFVRTDNDFLTNSKFPSHGSTATTALMLGNRLYCANVGDSRIVLSRDFNVVEMTHDHKPSREDESKRIRDAGGFVINNRVMGELAVSRAFGDCDFKKGLQGIIEEDLRSGAQLREDVHVDTMNWDQPLIIAEPEIRSVSITERDNFLVLACDGLYDVFTNEEIVSFVKANMEEHKDTQRCCQNLTYEAINKRNSRDNVSVILIILNKWW